MARQKRRRRLAQLPDGVPGYRLISLTRCANAASKSNTGSKVIRAT